MRFLLFFLLTFDGFTSAFGQTSDLKIAVAANFLPPMNQVKALYEEKFQGTLTLIVASSGKLTAQITNGAPYDFFISADMKYPENIYEQGLAQQKPEVLAYGTLYFWSAKPNITSVEKRMQKAKTIAIAQPDLAPYGKITRQWLQQHGWWDEVKDKLVYAENISQVNQYIATEAVITAFTANSAQHIESIQQKGGSWQEVEGASPLPHGMVLLRNAEAAEFTVDQFLEFIVSPVAQKVFQDFGYQLP
ncbi:molybdate ABC transporter substrate-binding protein [Tunicatimonas pelagia]|uniref:molybdate ABC transporter substrate-binding protein n=1 Tax=Tunicatimonas pelagia TaxID=931531 RepID=UPI002665F1EA|nr:molybdate ABC transporter substrate-binding protein [Tunicatimonas pelagia]WKN42457.1 molybdate ABC transporter substrate-binding protein [Tunicatimonas pelagia]